MRRRIYEGIRDAENWMLPLRVRESNFSRVLDGSPFCYTVTSNRFLRTHL